MVKIIIENTTQFINKYEMKSGDEYLELKYGVSIIVLNIFKIMAVIIAACILGIGKYMGIYFMAFACIRMYAFGGHARSSIVCTILNFVVFIGGTYLCLFIEFNNYGVITMFLINMFILYKYAPAATKKRPIVSSKMIKRCKMNSIVWNSVLMMLSIIVKDDVYKALITFGSFTACFFITPLGYKLLKEE